MGGGDLLYFLIRFIDVLADIIVYAIIARIILSWLRVGGKTFSHNRIVQVLHEITEPFYRLARKLPHRAGMFDFSPLIALIGVDLLSQLVITLLASLL